MTHRKWPDLSRHCFECMFCEDFLWWTFSRCQSPTGWANNVCRFPKFSKIWNPHHGIWKTLPLLQTYWETWHMPRLPMSALEARPMGRLRNLSPLFLSCTETPAFLLPGEVATEYGHVCFHMGNNRFLGLETSRLGGPQLPATAEYSDRTDLASIEPIFKMSKISIYKCPKYQYKCWVLPALPVEMPGYPACQRSLLISSLRKSLDCPLDMTGFLE